VNEKTSRALYPYGHPYSWPTIGYVEDLDRVDVDDLKRFFLRWYGPNNATVTVAGAVNPAEVVKLVEKYFGSIPPGPEVKPLLKSMVKLNEDRYISYADNVALPMLKITYPSVHSMHPDEPALDALAEIIGGGSNKQSPLYKRFILPRKAVQANASNPTSELSGTFGFTFVGYPNDKLADIEKEFREVLAEIEKNGVSDEDVQRFIARHEMDVFNRLASVSGKASILASNQTFHSNPKALSDEMKRYRSITKKDVMRVFRQYILNSRAVILSVYPQGFEELKAAPDNFTFQEIVPVPVGDEYKNLVYNKPKDDFDRSKMPKAGPSPVLNIPAFYTKTFKNGLKVIGTKTSEIPLVSMQLTLGGGHLFDSIQKSGTASLMVEMMKEATTKSTVEQLTKRLGRIGASIDLVAGQQEININISTHKNHVDSCLAILEEVLMHPSFNDEDFERVKARMQQNILNQKNQPVSVANNVFFKLLYGNENIFGWPTIGTSESVDANKIDDIKDFYARFVGPDIASLVIVGDIDEAAMMKKVTWLENWKSKGIKWPNEPEVPKIEKPVIYWVHKDKAAQSEIRIGYVAMPFDAAGEFFKSTIMNFSLGGTFNSRINLNLREDKGWTYGARASFTGSRYHGPYIVSGGILANATDSALIEFIRELREFADKGITEEELEYTKNSMGQIDAIKYETPGQKASFLRRIIDYDLKADYVTQQNNILKKISKKEIDELAKKQLPVDNMMIVVVGDKNLVYERVVKLGYEIIDVNAEGKNFLKGKAKPNK
jgi:zinc protease